MSIQVTFDEQITASKCNEPSKMWAKNALLDSIIKSIRAAEIRRNKEELRLLIRYFLKRADSIKGRIVRKIIFDLRKG